MSTPASIKLLPDVPTADELEALRAVPKNARDQALIEIMAGCGLRVSEACGLQVDQVHWTGTDPCLRFPGRGGRERVVPLNRRTQDALRVWLEKRDHPESAYVFCNLSTGARLSRKTVWAALRRHARRAGVRPLHPHMLRHAFGAALAERAVPVERIQALMGHAQLTSSQAYVRVSGIQKQQAVERIDRRSRIARWFSRLRNRSYRFLRPVRVGKVFVAPRTVGREEELRQLRENVVKRIDTLLLGPTGSGKSHLLDLIDDPRLIYIRGLTPARQALTEIAAALYERGAFPTDAEDFEAVKKQHARTTVQGWTRLVVEAVEKDEWVLVVDDLTDLSVTAGKLMEQLSGKFVLVGAAEAVKKGVEKHFWRFERIALPNLPQIEARRLVRQRIAGVEVHDPQLLETQVMRQSAGNPRAIVESVARLRKEPAVTRQAVRDLHHTGARPQIDLTPAVVLPILMLMAARFIARGLGDMEFTVLAGVGAAMAMGVQFFLFRFRR